MLRLGLGQAAAELGRPGARALRCLRTAWAQRTQHWAQRTQHWAQRAQRGAQHSMRHRSTGDEERKQWASLAAVPWQHTAYCILLTYPVHHGLCRLPEHTPATICMPLSIHPAWGQGTLFPRVRPFHFWFSQLALTSFAVQCSAFACTAQAHSGDKVPACPLSLKPSGQPQMRRQFYPPAERAHCIQHKYMEQQRDVSTTMGLSANAGEHNVSETLKQRREAITPRENPNTPNASPGPQTWRWKKSGHWHKTRLVKRKEK